MEARNHFEADDSQPNLAEIKPTLVLIENLQNETQRLYEMLKSSNLVAPMTGIVVKHQCVAGKWVDTSEILLEIVEEGSVEPVIFLSQGDTRHVTPGTEIVIHIAPANKSLKCRVKRLADEFRVPPTQLIRYYDSGEPLLPVILEPIEKIAIRPGAMVKVPHDFEKVFGRF
jgi:hypothetical protein